MSQTFEFRDSKHTSGVLRLPGYTYIIVQADWTKSSLTTANLEV